MYVFFFKFVDANSFDCVHAAETGTPAVEGVLWDVVLVAEFGDGFFALFGLMLDGGDLLDSELTFLHLSILPFGAILTI